MGIFHEDIPTIKAGIIFHIAGLILLACNNGDPVPV